MEQKYLLLNEGEVIKWQGLWSAEKEIYAIGDVVAHAKTGYGTCAYKAIVGHVPSAATEPEVGASWETVWAVFLMGGQNGTGEGTGDVISAGKAGGQTVTGGTGAGEDLSLVSTSHGTKGKIKLGAASAYDQINDRLGIGTASPENDLSVIKTVAGEVSAIISNLSTSASAWAGINLKVDTYGWRWFVYKGDGDRLSLWSDTKERVCLYVTSAGNLVIPGYLSANGHRAAQLAKTADYTITDTDPDIVVVGALGAHATITLPTAADNIGRIITVIIDGEPGAYDVIVDGEGAETINGAATKTNSVRYSYLRLLCNGVGWDIIGSGGNWA